MGLINKLSDKLISTKRRAKILVAIGVIGFLTTWGGIFYHGNRMSQNYEQQAKEDFENFVYTAIPLSLLSVIAFGRGIDRYYNLKN